MTMKTPKIRFAFFGTDPLAHAVLDELEKVGLTPELIVAAPDKIARDKSAIFPTEKSWAESRGIPVEQPARITPEFLETLSKSEWDVFIVASYGNILPKELLDMPKHGTLNLHPSLLPKLRGPSPIRSAILTDEKETGVSIMLLDEELDHGPLIGQKKVGIEKWPPGGNELDAVLAHEGAVLLTEILPRWIAGEITPQEQNHLDATFTKIFMKEEGLLNLVDGDPYQNLLKIRAFEGWPGTYSFFERDGKRIRVVVLTAHMEGKKLVIDTVKPEGKGEMSYADFLRSGAKPAA